MSALARWFNARKVKVAGYDKTPTPLTTKLQEEGMDIHFSDDISLVPSDFISDPQHTLVVYTPAISKLGEMNYFMNHNFAVHKRSQVLGWITENSFTVAVAGTHGKTTTSSIIAHLLKEANISFSAFLGGIAANFNSNFIDHQVGSENRISVVEADEYDRSFLTLHPNIAVVTSMDADHLDIYNTEENLKDSFKQFIYKLHKQGTLIINDRLGIADELEINTIKKYGINRGQFFAGNIRIKDGFFQFDFLTKNLTLNELKLGVPGFYNIENAIAATLVALELNIEPEIIRRGLASYKGVSRRFEYIVRGNHVIYIDDYAHHPAEIEAFLTSVRELYKGRKITAIFQPHLFTRTRDFAEGFGKSLSLADEIILLDIYPAREEPINGITSNSIREHITHEHNILCSMPELISKLDNRELDILVTIGAGDIDKMVLPLKEYITSRYEKVV